MNLVLVFCIFVTFVALVTNQKLVCNENDLKRIDEVYSKMLTIGEPNRKFPSDQLEAKQYCV
jgi:hypothetical protein